jgi:predicted transport protein
LFIAAPQPIKGTSVLISTESGEQEPVEETQVYSIEDHTKNKSKEMIQLFERLREGILALAEEGEIIEKANKMYIGYKHGKNFCEVRPQTKFLLLWLDIQPSDLDDPNHIGRDVSQIGHYGTGLVEIKVSDIVELGQALNMITQAYKQTI